MYNNTRTICILCISYVNSCSLLERGSIPDGSSPSIVKGVTKISASRRVPFFAPLAARRSSRWNRTQEETVPSLRDRSNGGKRSRKRRAAGENRRSGKKITKTPRVVCLCFSKYFYSPYTRTISKRKRKKKRRYPFSCFLAVVSLADASQSIMVMSCFEKRETALGFLSLEGRMLENEREKNKEDENWREKKKDKETKLTVPCVLFPFPILVAFLSRGPYYV